MDRREAGRGASARGIAPPEAVRWLTWLVLLALGVLVVLLLIRQTSGSDGLTDRWDKQRTRLVNVVPERGRLLDTNGVPLCWNESVQRLYVDPNALRDPRESKVRTAERIWEDLQRFRAAMAGTPLRLGYREDWILEQLKKHGFVPIMLSGPEGESAATMARYSRFRADFPAIGIANGQKRKAADLPGLWNLLGRVGTVREYRVGGEDLNYAWPMTRGVGGMEAKLNPYLCGEPGIEALTVGALGLSRFAQGEVRPATDGRAVHLTLDCRIQNLAEQYLLPSGAGAVMVVEVGSMKVRASVTGESADYSPSAEEYRGFESEPGGALLDWPRFWRTPPGSTFKMVTITAALMSGKLTPDERFHCPGYCMVGGVRRKCSHIHGWVNAEEALAGSCNVFTYRAAQRVGGDMVHRWARTMGFGRELPTEAYAPDIARSGLMSASHWGETGLWNLCIGQGETNITVAGLAMYVCALRNRELRTLVYVEPVGLSESEQEALGPHRLGSVPIREDVWDVISSGMRRCTEEGTARSARVSGVDILAKTGTAEIGGKHKNGLLVALVPAQEPKYCIVCAAADSEFSGGKMFGRRLHEFVGALLDAKLLPSTPDIAWEDR